MAWCTTTWWNVTWVQWWTLPSSASKPFCYAHPLFPKPAIRLAVGPSSSAQSQPSPDPSSNNWRNDLSSLASEPQDAIQSQHQELQRVLSGESGRTVIWCLNSETLSIDICSEKDFQKCSWQRISVCNACLILCSWFSHFYLLYSLPPEKQKTSTRNKVGPETVAMDIGLEQLSLLLQTASIFRAPPTKPISSTSLFTVSKPCRVFLTQCVQSRHLNSAARLFHSCSASSFDKCQGEVRGGPCSSLLNSHIPNRFGVTVCSPWDGDCLNKKQDDSEVERWWKDISASLSSMIHVRVTIWWKLQACGRWPVRKYASVNDEMVENLSDTCPFRKS